MLFSCRDLGFVFIFFLFLLIMLRLRKIYFFLQKGICYLLKIKIKITANNFIYKYMFDTRIFNFFRVKMFLCFNIKTMVLINNIQKGINKIYILQFHETKAFTWYIECFSLLTINKLKVYHNNMRNNCNIVI